MADCIGVHYNERCASHSRARPTRQLSDLLFTDAERARWRVFNNRRASRKSAICTEGYVAPLPAAFAWAANNGEEQANWLAQAAVQAGEQWRVRLMIVFQCGLHAHMVRTPGWVCRIMPRRMVVPGVLGAGFGANQNFSQSQTNVRAATPFGTFCFWRVLVPTALTAADNR